ncbi:MAG: helix-turn-helix domain-containing protein [Magnetococcales bacterium]|nr:helix-turn-helix domain-containing protein [Magnetococcales bacterium]
MDDSLFSELTQSVKEAGSIKRGEKKPSREFAFAAPDVKAIRKKTGLSQSRFSQLLGVSIKTLQNWEQGRRHPQGPARVLLTVFRSNPNAVTSALGDAHLTH